MALFVLLVHRLHKAGIQTTAPQFMAKLWVLS